MSDMTKEGAISMLERLRFPEPWEPKLSKGAEEALDIAISALFADGEYIKKEDIINKIEILDRRYGSDFYWETRKIIDKLSTYSFHDLSENKCFDGMINREIISEFVERDDSFAIMVDEVNGTVNIELSLDFWNAPYQKGE